MKVNIKTTSDKVQSTVKKVVSPKINVENKWMVKKPLDSAWATLERKAENMSPEEYIKARNYLASLEHLYMFEK